METACQQELWKLHANRNLWKLHANRNYGNCMPTVIMETVCRHGGRKTTCRHGVRETTRTGKMLKLPSSKGNISACRQKVREVHADRKSCYEDAG